MKDIFRKLLSLILVLCVLITSTPFSAFAIEPNICEIISTEGTKGFTRLEDALASIQDGDTLKILRNITYDKRILIESKRITIDLNGFNLNVENYPTKADYDREKSMLIGYGLYITTRFGPSAVYLKGEGEFNVNGDYGGVCAVVTNYGLSDSRRIDITVTNVSSNTGRAIEFGKLTSGGIEYNPQGATMTVRGNVEARDGYAVYTSGFLQSITVGGNVIASGGHGITANWGAEVMVLGDVNVDRGSSSNRVVAVGTDNMSKVTVDGSIVSTGTESAGIEVIRPSISKK